MALHLSFDRDPPPLSVGQLTARIKSLLACDPGLRDVAVRGELSNVKFHQNGSLYFTLKDAAAQLRGVMWSSEVQALVFRPEDGTRVVCRGRIGVYDQQGTYQLYASSIAFDGVGALYEQFERLRQRLQAEGLFGPERKRPMSRFPQTVGVVTSPTGAAVRDVISVLRRRSPGTRVFVFPALVQGAEATDSLIEAMKVAHRHGGVEVLIIARGGGSLEDLWAFNDERLVRAAGKSRIPFVSAVGHETDTTLFDFVADLRAPTPSAAAELVVPARAELRRQIRNQHTRAARALQRQAERARYRLRTVMATRTLARPRELLEVRRQARDELWEAAAEAMAAMLVRRRDRVDRACAQLVALDPRAVLQRGYSLFQYPDGSLIASVADARAGAEAEVVLRDGKVATRILAD